MKGKKETCKDCGALLIAFEAIGKICNKCLDARIKKTLLEAR